MQCAVKDGEPLTWNLTWCPQISLTRRGALRTGGSGPPAIFIAWGAAVWGHCPPHPGSLLSWSPPRLTRDLLRLGPRFHPLPGPGGALIPWCTFFSLPSLCAHRLLPAPRCRLLVPAAGASSHHLSPRDVLPAGGHWGLSFSVASSGRPR